MTSIILRGVENGNFKYLKFIASRAKRIVPALMVTVLSSIIVGFFILSPASLKLLGEHSLSSLFFLSNIQYWLESGYFDVNSSKKILLHTWSLSVEWQFYMLYPLYIIITHRYFKYSTFKIILLASTFLFFLLSLYLSFNDKTMSYYSLPSRAWELMIGGIAYIYPLRIGKKRRIFIEVTCISIIILSAIYITSVSPWPGYLSLAPVIATSIIISYDSDFSLFNNSLIQKIGLWSYSIYLTHWPILSLSKYIRFDLGFLTFIVVTLFASIILHYSVERKRDFSPLKLMSYIIICLISYFIYLNGLSWRVDEKYRLSLSEFSNKYYGGNYFYNETQGKMHTFNNKKNVTDDFILVGDSYAMMYIKYFNDLGLKFTSFTRTGCLVSKDYVTTYDGIDVDDCDKISSSAISYMKENKSSPVIISQNWVSYYSSMKDKTNGKIQPAEKFESILKGDLENIIAIGGDNRNYYIIGTYNYPGYDAYDCLARQSIKNFISQKINRLIMCPVEVAKFVPSVDNVLRDLSKNHRNVIYIDPKEYQCTSANKCKVIIDNNLVFFDGYHLSTFGAEKIGRYILDNVK